ncbi:MAG: DUF86 domain-containing protein [Actinomycetota bacterium]|nr:DUF86 domain-containing protein [Actinomycetota bacterium]
MLRRERDWLLDILDAIDLIEQYTGSGMPDPDPRNPVWDGVLFNLMVVGEASSKLPDELRSRAPDVDWRGAIGMRNVIAHEYFAVKREIVEKAVREDLPSLREAVTRLLRELDEEG